MKRQLLVGGIALSMLLTVGACGSGGGAGGGESPGDGDKSIVVMLPNHRYSDFLMEIIPRFEEESGIKVEVNKLGEDQLSDQYNVKLNAGSSDFDVMNYRPMQEAALFNQNGWLADLSEYVANAPEEWQADDLQASALQAMEIDGTLVGIPMTTERQVLYYRTDLLDAAGLEVPETLEELEAAAAALHNPDEGIYGFVGRGQRAAAVTQLSGFFYAYGADWQDGTTGTVDSPEAKQAYEYYGGLLREYGPPGVSDMSWPQAVAIFQQGQAAFYPDGDSFFTNFTDPEASVVTDTVGYAMIPAGPAGTHPYNISNNALGINEFSTKKDLAWEFIQWASSPEIVLEIQTAGLPTARTSAWDDPAASTEYPEQLVEVIQQSIDVGSSHDRPQAIQIGKARDIVGMPLIVAIEGGDVSAAADQAAMELTELLEAEAADR